LASSPHSRAVDYLAVGNPTIDYDDGGARTYGGSSLYAVTQAARLGCKASLYGCCAPSDRAELERLLPDLATATIQESRRTTAFQNLFSGEERAQVLMADAGPISLPPTVSASICHLCPVAHELSFDDGSWAWLSHAGLVCCTPQGTLRHPDADGRVSLAAIEGDPELWARVDVLVVSEEEEPFTQRPIEMVHERGGIIAVTLGPKGAIIRQQAREIRLPGLKVWQAVDQNGAGDVFAASFAVALARGDSLDCASAFAVVASGLSVTARGTAAIASQDQIDAHMG
jgi:sugar/nucleoside kinase (ribokinase family)